MAEATYTISAHTPYALLPEQLTVDEYIQVTRVCRATAYQHGREGRIQLLVEIDEGPRGPYVDRVIELLAA